MTFLDDLRRAARLEIAAGKRPAAHTWFRWQPEEDEAVIAMRANGFGFKDIARALPGRTPNACTQRWHQLMGKGE